MKYIESAGQKLRLGYTTGSCAAGAALAAATMLETGEPVEVIQLMTPAGILLKLEVEDVHMEEAFVSCAIRKDSGDDPDTTDGMLIYAKVEKTGTGTIEIDGGIGIGTIEKKGLFGELGEKAINPVPKKMIREALESVSKDGYRCIIYAPEGELIGKRTYNPNLGIMGGISIIGTSGIVYPMSEDAIIKTIELEIDVVEAEHGLGEIMLVPGNYGEKMKAKFQIELPHVQMSNYIGDALKYAYNKGFRNITLLGHIGKFSKLSLGIFNTHSKHCDTRMEAFVYYLYWADAPRKLVEEIAGCNTAEEAMNRTIEAGYASVIRAMEEGAEKRIKKYLKDEDLKVRVRIYSMEKGIDWYD